MRPFCHNAQGKVVDLWGFASHYYEHLFYLRTSQYDSVIQI